MRGKLKRSRPWRRTKALLRDRAPSVDARSAISTLILGALILLIVVEVLALNVPSPSGEVFAAKSSDWLARISAGRNFLQQSENQSGKAGEHQGADQSAASPSLQSLLGTTSFWFGEFLSPDTVPEPEPEPHPTPRPGPSPRPSPSPKPSPPPSPSPTPTPHPSPSHEPDPSPSPQPTPNPSPSPTPDPSPSQEPSPSPEPSSDPSPSPEPSSDPSPSPLLCVPLPAHC